MRTGTRGTYLRAPRLVVGMCLVLSATGCGIRDTGPSVRRGPVSLEASRVQLVAPDRIAFDVPSCGGDPEVTELAERGYDIRIEVTSTVIEPGNACADGLTVTLPVPLERRDLVDLTSGTTLEVIDREDR